MENMNKMLSNIAAYYLDVLSHDENAYPSVFAAGRNDNTDYVELPYFPALYNKQDEGLDQEILSKVMCLWNSRKNRGSNNVPVIGYPVYAEHITSGKGWKGYILKPFFIFDVDSSRLDELHIPEPQYPQINRDVLGKIANTYGSEIMEVCLDLISELGIGDYSNPSALDDFTEKLGKIRPSWNWIEKPDIRSLDASPELKNVKNEGFYNRACFFVTERSKYTKGLEFELNALKSSENSLVEKTFFYSLFSGESDNIRQKKLKAEDQKESTAFNDIIQAVPLNEEQAQAVRTSLDKPLTVITGPPGTGKSQVVTGIVVNAMLKGKKVLVASKNNKAVDVVESRINNLSEYPALLRLGSDRVFQNLSYYITRVVSSRVEPEDLSRYQDVESRYKEAEAALEKIKGKQIFILKEINELDKYANEVEAIREKYESCVFKQLLLLDPAGTQKIIEDLEISVLQADKNRQNIFIKLFWKFISEKRLKNLDQKMSESWNLLKDMGLTGQSEYIPAGEKELYAVAEIVEKALIVSTDLVLINRYSRQLNRTGRIDTVESLYAEERILKSRLYDAAVDMWKLWLKLLPNRLSSESRLKLNQFNALLRLMISSSINGNIEADLRKQFSRLSEEITSFLSGWAITSLSARGKLPFVPGYFDIVVIDEASQCDIASALPLLYRAKQAVIIGDPFQLKHISTIPKNLDLQLMRKYNLLENPQWSYSECSLYDLASAYVDAENIIQLRDHHRSKAEIIGFSNKLFYDGKLRIATNYDSLVKIERSEDAVKWINVKGKAERPPEGGARNNGEAEVVAKIVLNLLKANDFNGTVGVVTPFRAQANIIRTIINDSDVSSDNISRLSFMSETVHQFQGDERDIIIFSPVVSEGIQDTALNFLDRNRHLFNVAVTRARSQLIVAGNMDYIMNLPAENILRKFAEYIIELKASEKIKADPAQVQASDSCEYPPVSRPETVSEWEKIFYRSLCLAGIKTLPQYQIDQYTVDFALFGKSGKLVIEVDGQMYHKDFGGDLLIRDRLRNMRLMEMGWDVMRFWVYQVRDDEEKCILKIKEWLADN